MKKNGFNFQWNGLFQLFLPKNILHILRSNFDLSKAKNYLKSVKRVLRQSFSC